MDTNGTLIWLAVALIVILGLLTWYVIHKGRLRPGPHVFRASRLTKGNRIFPTQLIITSSSITQLQPQWIGKQEQSLHMAHVASIDIDTNVIFSDISIETTGGHNPLVCHGHSKGDAVKIKAVIEGYQSDYYKKERSSDPGVRR